MINSIGNNPEIAINKQQQKIADTTQQFEEMMARILLKPYSENVFGEKQSPLTSTVAEMTTAFLAEEIRKGGGLGLQAEVSSFLTGENNDQPSNKKSS